ncbi:cytochrome P450 4p1-like [Musca vetustissima]|uniref:cytochrome P450 4p1-like n=1 Tax=Musca vetustissima TaxID=27455 RepID=UPI002AB5EEA5|nr:cytochrome P450 4p1-like [Musca vetustissima]
MLATILIAILIGISAYCLWHLNKNYALASWTRKIKTIDGTPVESKAAVVGGFWGSNFDLLSMNLEEFFDYSRIFAENLKRNYIQYFLLTPVYNIIDAESAELVLNDSRLLAKGVVYEFLHPFLKTGLLTSTGKKWYTRRRLLTPTFHFNILQHFMDTFKHESKCFVDNLKTLLESGNSTGEVSLSDVIPRFTLNNICETALGVRLDERLDGDEYREHISKVEEMLVERLKNPLNTFDFIYNNFSDGKRYLKAMEKLHAFSSGIIEKRRELLGDELQKMNENAEQDLEANIYRKQRYAMLDSLLRAEKQGLIDHAGICEEVDTFMFEGFDTTSMHLIFVLMNFALYPEMQEKCYREIIENISGDLSTVDMSELSNLKYLDCFIKETQRLYPSVPIIIRETISDIVFADQLLFPKNTQINIHIYDIHRNPKYYKDPNAFRPERFFSTEAEQRHPFAFIPFSAGQRNCIGQKFAMLEIKTLLVHILKNFRLEPITTPESFRFSAGLLLRTNDKVKIKIKKRETL